MRAGTQASREARADASHASSNQANALLNEREHNKADGNFHIGSNRKLHDSDKDQIDLAEPKQPSNTETANAKLKNGNSDFLQKILRDANYRSSIVSKINGVLHAAASVTAFAHGSKGPLGIVNKFFDKVAFAFTKFVAPIISYGLRGFDSLRHKNILEAVIKFIPPFLMPFIGDANVDVVYGLSTGLNCMHDLAQDSANNKAKSDSNFADKVEQSKKSYRQYASMLLKEVKDICVKFVKGGLDKLQWGTTLASFMIFGGALPIILFARNARDSIFARAVGLFRNIGGIVGDVYFMLDKKDAHKRKTGFLCALAGLCDIAKRWVGDKWGQIFIHAAAAFNVSGYAVWNSRDHNKTPEAAA